MKILELFVLILSLLFAPLASLLGPSASLLSKTINEEKEAEVQPTPTPTPVKKTTPENTSRVKSPITVDLEGYCTVEIPLSHFKESSNSATTRKTYIYKDEKSKVTIGYTTGIEEDTDIAGYITQEIAEVDIATNTQEDTDINGKTFTVVPSPDLIAGKMVTVYYTVKGPSAFWLRSEVVPDSNDDEYAEAVDYILKSLYVYFLEGGTIFETPETGIYENVEADEQKGNQDRYEETSVYNTVFGDRGGYVKDADIPTSWDCMQMIVDGIKLKVPCTMQDLYDAGYKVNTYTWDYAHGEEVTVDVGGVLELSVINDKGTVLDLEIQNQSQLKVSTIDECNVVTIKVDKEKFKAEASEQVGHVKTDVRVDSKLLKGFTLNEIAKIGNQTYKRLSDEEKAYVDEVKKKIEEGRYKYPDAIYGSGKATEEYTDEELERIKEGLPAEYINEETEGTEEGTGEKSAEEVTGEGETEEKETDTEVKEGDTSKTEDSAKSGESTDSTESNSNSESTDDKEVKSSEDESKSESSDSSEKTADKSEDTKEENSDEQSGEKSDSEEGEKSEDSDNTDNESSESDKSGTSEDKTGETTENVEVAESTVSQADLDAAATLILPGGITWTVYTDDLVKFYGTGCSRNIVSKECVIVYKSGNKKLEIHLGIVGGINSVEMSVLAES